MTKKRSKVQAKKRIEKLRKEIDRYRYNYHVLNKSIMSEAAADSLKHELSELETKYPELITPNSPTQRVAGEVSQGFNSVKHDSRMLSLQDVFDKTELQSWIDRIVKLASKSWKPEFHVDLKLDGLACSLVYEDGRLVRGVTRGDGTVGEDVTANIRTINSIPLQLRGDEKFHTGRIEIRGEILLYKKDFEELNKLQEKKGLPKYANPRNTAAGTIRQLDSSVVAARPLKFHAWSVIHPEIKTHEQKYRVARNLGFITSEHTLVAGNINKIEDFADKWERKRETLPFNTDGLVITVNDQVVFEKLGTVGKAPRGAVAYKFPAEEATTKILDIIISVGRTGAATPVALLEPVVVAGSTVQHASLHNQDEIMRKDIRIGDTVIIHKAGDIIPQVVRVLKDLRTGNEKKFDFEKKLEQHPLEFKRDEGEVAWRAIERDNPTILKRSLEHFCSKSALDIEGMGEKNAELLVDEGVVNSLADIFRLKKEDLLELDRFADKSAENLINAINTKKSPELYRFLYGLGIRHVGAQTAVDLANRFKSMDALSRAGYEELAELDGIGEVVAHSIEEWFADERNQDLLHQFRDIGVWPKKVSDTRGSLSGKSFVMTGTLESMSRDDAAEKIRALGGTFQSSITNDTTFLVVGDNPGNSKLKKVEKTDTEIIDEEKLLKLLDQI